MDAHKQVAEDIQYLSKICKTEEFKETIRNYTFEKYSQKKSNLDPFLELAITLFKSTISYHLNQF